MAHTYLLEIGTEELPVGFQRSARQQLAERVEASLTAWGADNASVTIHISTTPRRIVLWLRNLPNRQPDRTVRIQGPSTQIGLGPDGGLTPAALGFARKQGVSPEDLTFADGYLVLNKTEAGQTFQQLVQQAAPDWIDQLEGSHRMRWGDGRHRFSRPIRWLLSLWDDDILPLTYPGLTADRRTYGHRLLSPPEGLPIDRIDTYMNVLQTHGVCVDHETRQQTIHHQLTEAANALCATPEIDPHLLETVTALVEHPSVVVGRFDERFLSLPDIVLTTVMAHHQKYFPVRSQADGRLLSNFLAVSNGLPSAADTIRQGNERVLAARFYDADFFFKEDQKTRLADRVETLAGLTFQKGLGTMKDKADRLTGLACFILENAGLGPETPGWLVQVKRAAQLCKADLTTAMVRELTELQGEMGRVYSLLHGEDPVVADAIADHYRPRFSGETVPGADKPVSMALCLADKIDTLVAVFSQKGAKLPTGSKDPLALRRMAAGIWLLMEKSVLILSLEALFRHAHKALEKYKHEESRIVIQDFDKTWILIEEFMAQRLQTYLEDEDPGLPPAANRSIQATLSSRLSLFVIKEKQTLLRQVYANERLWSALLESAVRVAGILKDKRDPAASYRDYWLSKKDISYETLKSFPIRQNDSSDASLLFAVQNFADDYKKNYEQLKSSTLNKLYPLRDAVNQFFENVMVNDPDPTIRQWRINLLKHIDAIYCDIWCDFLSLPGGGTPSDAEAATPATAAG